MVFSTADIGGSPAGMRKKRSSLDAAGRCRSTGDGRSDNSGYVKRGVDSGESSADHQNDGAELHHITDKAGESNGNGLAFTPQFAQIAEIIGEMHRELSEYLRAVNRSGE